MQLVNQEFQRTFMYLDACSKDEADSQSCCVTMFIAVMLCVNYSIVFGRHDSEAVGLSRL